MVGGLHVGKLVQNPQNIPIIRRHMESLADLAAEGAIKPVIDSEYHFEEVSVG